jgi:hypothetical protein
VIPTIPSAKRARSVTYATVGVIARLGEAKVRRIRRPESCSLAVAEQLVIPFSSLVIALLGSPVYYIEE